MIRQIQQDVVFIKKKTINSTSQITCITRLDIKDLGIEYNYLSVDIVFIVQAKLWLWLVAN